MSESLDSGRPAGAPRHGVLASLRPHDALLALEDGTVFFGWSCGAPGESSGECVFNTSMSGYPEIITDPSYRGQIVTFTYPLIGNYGINAADAEGPKPQLSAVVVRTMCGEPSSWRSKESLPDYLRRHRIVAIEGVDTRMLTRKLRSAGVMRAVVSTRDLDPESLVARARASAGLVGRDLVAEVTPFEATPWLMPLPALTGLAAFAGLENGDGAPAPPVAVRPTLEERLRELPADIELTDEDRRDLPGRIDPAVLAVEAAIEARRSGVPMVLPAVEMTLRRPREMEKRPASSDPVPE